MRYILSESNAIYENHADSRRFFLCEELEDDIAALQKAIPECEGNIERAKENVVDAINASGLSDVLDRKYLALLRDLSALEKTINKEKHIKNIEELKSQMSGYIAKVRQTMGADVNAPKYKDLKAELDSLESKIKEIGYSVNDNDKVKQRAEQNIKNVFGKLSEIIKIAFGNSNAEGINLAFVKDIINKTAELGGKLAKAGQALPTALLDEGDHISAADIAKHLKPAEALNSALGGAIDGITAAFGKAPAGLITQDNAERIAGLLSSAVDALDGYMAAIAEHAGAADALKKQGKAGTDWKTRLDAAGGDAEARQAIWDEYYETEWGEDAKKIQALGKAFDIELSELGFSETTNPFISFVKIAIREGLPLDKQHYDVIHNAYANYDKKLTGKDLRGTGVFGLSNIIFNPDLYAKTATMEANYLSRQKIIADQYKNGATDKLVDRALTDFYATKPERLLNAVMHKTGDVRRDITGPADDALANIEEVNRSIGICFGDDLVNAEAERRKTAFSADRIKFADKRDYIQALAFIRERYATGRTIDRVNDEFGRHAELKVANFDPKNIRAMTAIFDNIDINDSNILDVIKSLIEKGGVK